LIYACCHSYLYTFFIFRHLISFAFERVRAGNEYWQDPALLEKPSPPTSELLEIFLQEFHFPKEAWAHIRILQYVFGPQSMVFSAKLTRDHRPYIEIYFYAMDSNRPNPYDNNGDLGNLNDVKTVLTQIESIYFGLERPSEAPFPETAIIASFEIHLDSYNGRPVAPFDYYTVSLGAPECAPGGHAVIVHQNNGNPPRGTFCREDVPEGPTFAQFFWRGVKSGGLRSVHHVGISSNMFLGKLRARDWPVRLLERFRALENLENAALEYCDNLDADGAYARGSIYGIV